MIDYIIEEEYEETNEEIDWIKNKIFLTFLTFLISFFFFFTYNL
jgi:hypothetical protein